jgi:cytochrome c oxidase subunit 1
MTVGSAVALTFMGIAYWMVPYLTGRSLWGRPLAVAQSWIYTIGVLVFARGMISGGLAGMPRRTFLAEATYTSEGWGLSGIITAVGGSIMTLGILVFFAVLAMTLLAGRRGEGPRDIPISKVLTSPASTGWELRLDRLGFWVVMAVLLIVIAYGPFFASYLPPNMVSPGYRFY